MKTAIYGAGAMGTVLGAYITRAGIQVDLITRNKAHVAALKSTGAHIVGTVEFTVPVSALLPEEMTEKYDLIFLMTKQRRNREICEFLSGYLKEDGAVVTMQNGFPEPSVASVLGENRTLGCAVSWGATFRGNGVSELTSEPGSMTFSLGSFEESSRHIDGVKTILSEVGKVEVEPDFVGARWAKLTINSAFSSISAITGMTFGEVASDKRTKPVVLALLNEAFSVADSLGITVAKIQGHDIVKIYRCRKGLKRRIALALLPLAMKRHKNLVSGMYFDLLAHNKCDMDYINGVIVHAARNFGVEVPVNKQILAVVSEIESGMRDVSKDNISLITL